MAKPKALSTVVLPELFGPIRTVMGEKVISRFLDATESRNTQAINQYIRFLREESCHRFLELLIFLEFPSNPPLASLSARLNISLKTCSRAVASVMTMFCIWSSRAKDLMIPFKKRLRERRVNHVRRVIPQHILQIFVVQNIPIYLLESAGNHPC
jgi:hypothetical protein